MSLRRLTQTEREDAFENARLAFAGPEPNPDFYRRQTFGRFPKKMVYIIYAMSLLLLIAAFLPSASRLYRAGYSEFCGDHAAQGQPRYTETECKVMGGAFVTLAETAQLLFFITLAVLPSGKTTTRVFYAEIVLSTLLALVGNWNQARPDQLPNFGFPFYWLVTLGPSLIVLGLGYALKDFSLHAIEDHHSQQQEYQRAVDERTRRYKHAETYGLEWQKSLSRAIRDSLRKANARNRAEFESLSPDELKIAVKEEMRAFDWSVTLEEVTPTEVKVIEEEVKTSHLEQAQTGQKFGTEFVFPTPNSPQGYWTVRSPLDGTILGTEYSSEGRAQYVARRHVLKKAS